jgi:uncharacterized membrane protein YdfJ with MMPL/SSD domain
VWANVGARAARRPAAVTLAAVLVLGLACAALASLRTSSNPLNDLKGHPGSIAGEQLLIAHFPAGTVSPLILLAPRSEAQAAARAARDTPGVAAVAADPPTGSYAAETVDLSVPPYSAKGFADIGALRQDLARAAPGALVGGSPAAEYDTAQAAGRDTVVIIPLVLLVILFVIAALLRAIVAAFVLVATTALSVGASFGLAALLWRYGFGYPGIDPQIPLYIFIFLTARAKPVFPAGRSKKTHGVASPTAMGIIGGRAGGAFGSGLSGIRQLAERGGDGRRAATGVSELDLDRLAGARTPLSCPPPAGSRRSPPSAPTWPDLSTAPGPKPMPANGC